jgi:hypothetical protein
MVYAMDAHTRSRTLADAPRGGTARDSNEIVVFSILRESACAECGADLREGDFMRLEAERALCLTCADLDRLVFLPSGDAALTRRATKHSALRAVVVRFSRSRKRYERQGILVEEPALERAERECLADAGARRLARERAAERRSELDEQYVEAFARRIGELFPGCPSADRIEIAEHACRKYSGRVGRSAAAKALLEDAVALAVRAHVRHVHTPYDSVLARGWDRADARHEVAGAVEERLEAWRHG